MIDAHLHLNRFNDPAVAWARLQAAGVTKALVPGVDEPYQTLDLEGVYSALGQHPLYPPQPGWDQRLKQALEQKRPAALGETGFDRNAARDHEQVTKRQLELAADHRLPLILHCVGVGSSLLKAVRNHPAPVMLHRCLGRPTRYQPWWEAGVYISIGPEVRGDLRLLKAVPADLLLLESDAEDESQAPWDTLPKLYLAAGRAKGLKAHALKTLVANNFQRFLGA